jgi:hypothetical protein
VSTATVVDTASPCPLDNTAYISGLLAWETRLPWVFPSLAPTVVLMFETPLRPQASPRNAVIGHGVGIGVGY